MNHWYEGLSLQGRVALVTGGSRGIGRGVCTVLAARGAAVAVHYNTHAALADEVVAQIVERGGSAAAFPADLADPSSPAALVGAVRAALGEVDILVNNAGMMTDAAVADMTDDEWDSVLAVNLGSAFRLARACIPAMRARGWGRIINVTSQAAYTGSREHASYAASKSGMHGLTFSLAKELASDGITVNQVAPGRIATDMVLSRAEGRMDEWMGQIPLRRFGTPEEVAAAVAFLAADEARYITGATLHVNGGMLMD
jgi:3-oxoacyl-[acyl-carrier protein] reductase